MGHGRWAVDDPRSSNDRPGTGYALRLGVKAKNLEDLVVHREAMEAAVAVSALLERAVFRKDFELTNQLSRSSARVAPLIAEGFGQLTDRHVAVYLGRARGSALETRTHLQRAIDQRYISAAEQSALDARYVIVGKRLTRWIQHLRRSDWKDRG
jgi:four helix bundle protein